MEHTTDTGSGGDVVDDFEIVGKGQTVEGFSLFGVEKHDDLLASGRLAQRRQHSARKR